MWEGSFLATDDLPIGPVILDGSVNYTTLMLEGCTSTFQAKSNASWRLTKVTSISNKSYASVRSILGWISQKLRELGGFKLGPIDCNNFFADCQMKRRPGYSFRRGEM